MVEIFTISAYQTTAEQFFNKILQRQADLVLDIRLKNESQLCGFTKKKDLAYLIPLICKADYICDRFFAPDPVLLNQYLKHWIPWEQYAHKYQESMKAKSIKKYFHDHYGKYVRVCLIGTATAKRRSHSEVLSEMLQN